MELQVAPVAEFDAARVWEAGIRFLCISQPFSTYCSEYRDYVKADWAGRALDNPVSTGFSLACLLFGHPNPRSIVDYIDLYLKNASGEPCQGVFRDNACATKLWSRDIVRPSLALCSQSKVAQLLSAVFKALATDLNTWLKKTDAPESHFTLTCDIASRYFRADHVLGPSKSAKWTSSLAFLAFTNAFQHKFTVGITLTCLHLLFYLTAGVKTWKTHAERALEVATARWESHYSIHLPDVPIGTPLDNWVEVCVQASSMHGLICNSTAAFAELRARDVPTELLFPSISPKKRGKQNAIITPTDEVLVKNRSSVVFSVEIDRKNMVVLQILINHVHFVSASLLGRIYAHLVTRQNTEPMTSSKELAAHQEELQSYCQLIEHCNVLPLLNSTMLLDLIDLLQNSCICLGLAGATYPYTVANCGAMRAHITYDTVGNVISQHHYGGRLIWQLSTEPASLRSHMFAETKIQIDSRPLAGRKRRRAAGFASTSNLGLAGDSCMVSIFRSGACSLLLDCTTSTVFDAICPECKQLYNTLNKSEGKHDLPSANVSACSSEADEISPAASTHATPAPRSGGGAAHKFQEKLHSLLDSGKFSRTPVQYMSADKLQQEIGEYRKTLKKLRDEVDNMFQEADSWRSSLPCGRLDDTDIQIMADFLDTEHPENFIAAKVSQPLREMVRFYVSLEKKRRATGRKYERSFEWPLFIIRLALGFHARDPAQYNKLRELLPLPSPDHIRQYRVSLAYDGNMNSIYRRHLQMTVDKAYPQAWQKDVILILDEVMLVGDIILKNNGEVVGLAAESCDDWYNSYGLNEGAPQAIPAKRSKKSGPTTSSQSVGTEGSRCNNASSMTGDSPDSPAAQLALVWVAHSPFNNVRVPLGFVLRKSVTGVAASEIVKKAVVQAHSLRLRVMGINSDGAPHYRSLQARLPFAVDNVVFPSINNICCGMKHPFAGYAYPLIFFSDIHHALKKIWRNLVSSRAQAGSATRWLQYDKALVVIDHLLKLYEQGLEAGALYNAAYTHNLPYAAVAPKGAEAMQTGLASKCFQAGAGSILAVLGNDNRSAVATSLFCSKALLFYNAATDFGNVFGVPQRNASYSPGEVIRENGTKGRLYRGAGNLQRLQAPYVHEAYAKNETGVNAAALYTAAANVHPLRRLLEPYMHFADWQGRSDAEDEAQRSKQRKGEPHARADRALRQQSFNDMQLLTCAHAAFTYFYIDCINSNEHYVFRFCDFNNLKVVGRPDPSSGILQPAIRDTTAALHRAKINFMALTVTAEYELRPARIGEQAKARYNAVLQTLSSTSCEPMTAPTTSMKRSNGTNVAPQSSPQSSPQTSPQSSPQSAPQAEPTGSPVTLQPSGQAPAAAPKLDAHPGEARFVMYARISTDPIENLFSQLRGFANYRFPSAAISAAEFAQRFFTLTTQNCDSDPSTREAAPLLYRQRDGAQVVRFQNTPTQRVRTVRLFESPHLELGQHSRSFVANLADVTDD